MDIFRGSASKKSLKYDHLRLYGSGKGLSRGDAERLAQTMATQRILEEYCETNGLGFVSSYVRLGRDANLLDTGKRRISMVHHVDSIAGGEKNGRNSAGEAPGGRRTKKGKGGVAHKNDDIRQTLLAFRHMDDGEECIIDDNYDFGDFYQDRTNEKDGDYDGNNEYSDPDDGHVDDGIEDDDEPYVIEDEITTHPPTPVTPTDYAEEQLRCFDQLLMLRENICMRENTTSKFLSNAILGELCRHPPTDVSSLKAIAGASPLIERHAQSILKITKKALIPAG